MTKELDEILDKLMEAHKEGVYTGYAEDKAKQAITALISTEVAKAKMITYKDQIMQDFLSLCIDLPENVNESDLINWRDAQLAALTAEVESDG